LRDFPEATIREHDRDRSFALHSTSLVEGSPMKYRTLDDHAGMRTFAVAFEIGEEVMSTLTQLAKDLELLGCSLNGIGGFQKVTLGYFDWEKTEFVQNVVDEQVELLSFQGNIAEGSDGGPKIHAHVVLGRRDASTRGGHLVEAIVRPTMEVIIVENPVHLHRRHDEATGLVLLKP
jgi:predicted DNA-binding protein with PD1-like motif